MEDDEREGEVMAEVDGDRHVSRKKCKHSQSELYAADDILLPGRRRAEKKRKKKAMAASLPT